MNHNKNNNNISKTVFYTLLCLALVAACAASYMGAKRMLNSEQKDENPKTPQPEILPSDPAPNVEDIPAMPHTEPAEPPVLSNDDTEASAAEPLLPIYSAPVEGAVTNPFSGYELVFNTTMKDWRTHNGADMDAAEGTEVHSVYAGTVTAAYNDDLWGGTISVRLDTNLVVSYKNLAEIYVREGQRISQDEVVGTVGSTAILETAQNPHLHIEVKSGDRFLDPAETLGLK